MLIIYYLFMYLLLFYPRVSHACMYHWSPEKRQPQPHGAAFRKGSLLQKAFAEPAASSHMMSLRCRERKQIRNAVLGLALRKASRNPVRKALQKALRMII